VERPLAIVVMGVSGCGKTTVASRLARRLRWAFAEADAFHSKASVAKMSAGTPLTDEDRWPWLDAVAGRIAQARASGRPCVVACSSLRRAYRERLCAGHGDVRFVYLRGSCETIERRLVTRSGHYMPASLLASQFATLEEPAADEGAVTVPAEQPVDAQVAAIVAALGLATPS
jgi:gluconokinase